MTTAEKILARIAKLKAEIAELEKAQKEDKKELEQCWRNEFGDNYKERFDKLTDNPEMLYDRTIAM